MASVAVTASAAPVPSVVSSLDFEDDSFAPWVVSGSDKMSGATVISYGGSKVLQVADRIDSFAGIESPTGLFEAGKTYHFSLKARLADGTPGSQNLRFVIKPGFAWVDGSNTAVSAGAWTEVAGTFAVAADAAAAGMNVYIGSGADGAGNFTYLIDDVIITGPPSAPPVPSVVSSLDFEDDSFAPWVVSGSDKMSGATVISYGGSKVLQVADRIDSFAGIESPTGLFEAGKTYHFSLKARLADGTPGSQNLRFVIKPGFAWVDGSNTAVSAGAWTEVAGTFAVAADAAAAGMNVYIGSGADGAGNFTYLIDDVIITGPPSDGGSPEPVETGTPEALNEDFESGLGTWTLRADGNGDPTVGISTAEFHGGAQSAEISNRKSQGSGIQHTINGILIPGTIYNVSAWAKFAGTPVDRIWLSAAVNGTSYPTLVDFEQVPNATGWTHLTGSFQAPAFETASVYFQTRWISDTDPGNRTTLYLDDIEFSASAPVAIEDLTPIKDTTSFPVGVAIDTRETAGAAKQLTLKHFDQITAENAMKPEGWYNASKEFAPNADIDSLIEFARDNDLKVYGHVLAWHSQTPAWFFQNASGAPLTSSPGDQEILRERLHDHIFNVAEYLSDNYGLFGSADNPVYAFDVVNEVVADSTEFADGLRRSPWYNVLGESYIALAFEYANEAFNDVYADPSASHPVTLFINDYNTEQSGKQQRYHDLVERLLADDVPVDGVGHQFHVALSTPVAALGQALTAFDDLPVVQAVTELDVTTGTPVSQAKLVDQGYYFQDAFGIFRAHADDLFSVTVWGLNDGRSWRNSSGAPLVFNDALQAKPAYYGIVAGESDEDPLPAPLRTADVFQADVPATTAGAASEEWSHLPLRTISANAAFQLRWEPDHLTVYAEVADATTGADGIEVELGGTTVTLGRDGTGTATGAVVSTGTGYRAIVELPLDGAQVGDNDLQFDIRVIDDGVSSGWNADGATGTLTLVEPVSFLEVVGTETAPEIDGWVEAVWNTANVVTTSKQVQGTGAVATVRTLWKGNTLYVLATVADPTVDVSASDPWVQDSVEIFVDAGNVKNGSYRYDDSQIRISAANRQSFGTGDEAYQANRVQSSTKRIDGGYLVEASVSLLETGGLGTIHGLDFQVNDATAGVRTGITNWADPTGVGYQSTARWGVGELVDASAADAPAPVVTLGSTSAAPGGTVDVGLSGLVPGQTVSIVLDTPAAAFGGGAGGFAATARGAAAASTVVGTLTANAAGNASGSVTVPAGTAPGTYRLAAVVGSNVLASSPFTVIAATIAATGADITTPLSVALLLLFAGLVFSARARRRGAALRH
ncbi:endo-1,4-beta-xylanase [Protaetiibacter larvae]|uniref:endo-1,4-beta-xylanase n=1 Tax=Protaetiibacter larvae TaxID=2592654 RepID=UPI00143DCA8B|nr:endo-1,4-beta-xylanase [Protaetiibacter larvae]